MDRNKKVLITGANGFTGRHACQFFADCGYDVTGMVRSLPSKRSDVKLIYGDLGCQQRIEEVIKEIKPELILHLAGLNNVGESWVVPAECISTNVMGTVHLLEAVRNSCPEAKMIVVGSMLQEQPEEIPANPYSLSKTIQFQVSKAWEYLYEMNILFVKPTNLIGPGPANGICSILARKIVQMEIGKQSGTISIDSLDASRDFLDVRDAVKAFAILAELGQKGHVYELGTGVKKTLREVIEELRQLSAIEFEVNEQKPQKRTMTHVSGYSTLQDLNNLGWEPSISLQTSLRDILEYHRRRIGENMDE